VKLSIKSIYKNPEIVYSYIDELVNLPTIPLIIKKINEVTRDPASSAKDLEKVILQDQSLTAKVLSLSNSAYYSFGREIKSVWQAIVLLGFETVKNLAISLSIINLFKSTNWVKEINPEKFWVHAFGVGVTADYIAAHSPQIPRQVAYLAGLLHDIGKVVFLKALEGEYMEVIDYAQNIGCSIWDAEESILGINHAKVGGYLAQKWVLPTEIKMAITYHHEPLSTDEHQIYPILINMADQIIKEVKIGFAGDNVVKKIPETYIFKLKISSIDILQCKEYLKEEQESIETLAKVIQE